MTAHFLLARILRHLALSKQILTPTNGLKAIALLAQICFTEACPELILLDINMPLMDNFEFLEVL